MTYVKRYPTLPPVGSVICLMLMFAAYDDIGSITETELSLEYAALGCYLAWFGVVALGLLRRRRRWLGAVTLIGVAILTWAVFNTARLQASAAKLLMARAAFVALVIVTLTLFTLQDDVQTFDPPV